MDRILQRLLNQFLGRLMNRAIDTGISYAARRGKDPAEMTRAERDSARNAKDLTKRARQLSRLTRRF